MMLRLTSLLITATIGLCGQSYGDSFALIRLMRRPSAGAAIPGIVSAHRNARVPVDVIGLRSITGLPQLWLVEAHGSFSAFR